MSKDQEIRPAKADRNGELSEQPHDLDKVRDILFGAQVRDHAERMGRMQANLLKEIAQLKSEGDRRFAALEQSMKDEFKMLTTRLEREEDERQADKVELASDMEKAGENLNGTIQSLADQTAQSSAELADRLSREAEGLRSELARKSAEILEQTRHDLEKLRDGKADRTVLSSLLTDLASRLTPAEEPQLQPSRKNDSPKKSG